MRRLSRGAWLALALMAAVAVPMLARGARAGYPAKGPGFNGGRAFQDLRHIVSLGPRPAGSKALETERRWIEAQLRQAGWRVEEDAYTADTPLGPIPEVNIIAKLPGSSSHVIMVAGHYDTKLFTQFRFVGANDGGSSAALLVELGRALGGRKPPLTTWLVFFDGEEAVKQWSSTDGIYGSRHLVSKWTASGVLDRIQAMILVDMIGGAQLQIHPDSNSTGWLNQLVFQTAHELGYARYFPSEPTGIEDDHIPFLNAGVSAVDLLGPVGPVTLESPFGAYWHTARDTLEHCSPTSLTIVGRVVVATLEKLYSSPRVK
jgi:Zn-dependent M28 family amino/carboxypeptidase